MKGATWAAAVLILAGIVSAQDAIPERLLLTTGQYVGTGARALGMAGTYTGIADDYSSVWWNPAGLSQVKRIELQASLARTAYGNKTDYYGGSDDGSTSSLRLNNVGMVFPVPVYQGALSFAFGYNQLVAFDRRTRIAALQQGAHTWDSFNELESGRIGQWTFAGAMDVSPNMAVGLGINYLTGLDDYSLTGYYTENATPHYSESSLTTDISGWGANLGALFRIGRAARLGAMIQTPVNVSINEDWTQDGDDGYFDYRMTYPAVIRVGGSYCPGRWLVAADIEYRDWTSLEFRTDTPYEGVTRVEANQQIKDLYQSTTRLSLGGEYLFPVYGLRLRAGYAYEPTSYKEAGSADDRNIIAFGVGVLVDRSVMLDATVQTSSYTEKVTPGLTEDISTTSALVTLSFRM